MGSCDQQQQMTLTCTLTRSTLFYAFLDAVMNALMTMIAGFSKYYMNISTGYLVLDILYVSSKTFLV